jgi:hypothetical protein
MNYKNHRIHDEHHHKNYNFCIKLTLQIKAYKAVNDSDRETDVKRQLLNKKILYVELFYQDIKN